MLEFLPEEQKDFGMNFCERLKKLKSIKVDEVVKDGETLNWATGCQVILTQGHTPGHTSLYFQEEKILITGDAGVIENNELVVANPHFCLDLENAEKSLERIKSMEVKTYICYHGGVLKK